MPDTELVEVRHGRKVHFDHFNLPMSLDFGKAGKLGEKQHRKFQL